MGMYDTLQFDPAASGWIPPLDRSVETTKRHDAIIQATPIIATFGSTAERPKWSVAWQFQNRVASFDSFRRKGHIKNMQQLTGSCFPRGTLVRMADGTEKAIEDVKVGDLVVTHTGNHRRVVRVFSRKFTGNMVTIQPKGFHFPLTMTEDHQVAVVGSAGGYRWQPGKLDWAKADDLAIGDHVLLGWSRQQSRQTHLDIHKMLGDAVIDLDALMTDGIAPVRANAAASQCQKSGIDWQDRVKMPRTRYENALPRTVAITPSLGRLLGLYLAEGGCDEGKVVFSFNGHTERTTLAEEVLSLVRGIFGVDGEIETQQDRESVVKVKFSNLNLERVLKMLMPGNVYSKRVPGFIFSAQEDVKLAMIKGWLDGDGHKKLKKTRVNIQGTTASAGLARDMTTLALSCGVLCATSRRKPRKRSREAYDAYMTGATARDFYPEIAAAAVAVGATVRQYDKVFTKFGCARRLKKITKTPVVDLEVFDFEVEEEHSFIAGGIVVHNCVGFGAANMALWTSVAEAVYFGEPERVLFPFFGYHYGLGRMESGINGRGEGSTGSGQAEALRKYGVLAYDQDGVPAPTNDESIHWTSSVEMTWSDGRGPAQQYLETGKKHLFTGYTKATTPDQAVDLMASKYWGTTASNWGGLMQCPIVGEGNNRVLLNKHSGSWNHQQWVCGYWFHPTLGLLFAIGNNWAYPHGEDADRNVDENTPPPAPPGIYWVVVKDFQYMIAAGETFFFTGLNGFPARPGLYSMI